MVKTCKHTPWFPVKISLNHQSNDESKLLWLMFGKGLMVKETFFFLSSTHGLPSPDHFPMIKSSFLAGEIQIQLAILAGEISIFQECLMVKSWLNRMFSQFFGVVKCKSSLAKPTSWDLSLPRGPKLVFITVLTSADQWFIGWRKMVTPKV